MQWSADISAGDWMRERIDQPWRGTMHDVVPRGFEAYARVFHPASRDRPVGRPWPGLPYAAHRRAWDDFQADSPQIDDESVTWATTAAAMGTTMHPRAQWHRLVAPGVVVENEDGPRDAAGWRYNQPLTGDAPAGLVCSLAAVLVRHTTTPDAGFAAVWEGFGGLLGHVGVGPSRGFYQITEDGAGADPTLARHNSMLGSATRDVFNRVFRRPTWQEGILSREISEAPRLQLPDRGFVLFHAGVAEFADPDWALAAPWRDLEAERHGFAPDAHAPGILWPEDRSWVSVTEVDFDSTIVGGTRALIDDLVADERLEALALDADADLTWDGDEVNR